MQTLDLLFFGQVCKFVLEEVQFIEFVRAEEVEQMEKLLQIVLQRRSSQQQFVTDVVTV